MASLKYDSHYRVHGSACTCGYMSSQNDKNGVGTECMVEYGPHVLYHAPCTDSILSGRVVTRTLPCTLYRLYSLWPCGHTYSTMHSVPTLFSLAVWPHVLYHALCTDSILSGRVATRTLPCTLYRLYSLWPCGHTYSTMHSVPTLFFLATYSTMHSVPTILSGRVATYSARKNRVGTECMVEYVWPHGQRE